MRNIKGTSLSRGRPFMAGVGAVALLVIFLIASFVNGYPAQVVTVAPWDAINVIVPVDRPAVYSYEILKAFPHDPDAFTQGLLYYKDDLLYESTGMYGESSVRTVDLETGTVLRRKNVPKEFFAEGLALFGNRLLQLTWLTNQGFAYAHRDLKPVAKFRTPLRDGWGLTNDNKHLIASDGSNRLYFLDPKTFEEVRRLEILDGGFPVYDLNELEYIEGEVWANIWQRECIARIDPSTGRLLGWVVLSGLKGALQAENLPQNKPMDVLNGIAYDAEQERLFVTGKYWPRLYQIHLTSPPGNAGLGLDVVRKMCIVQHR